MYVETQKSSIHRKQTLLKQTPYGVHNLDNDLFYRKAYRFEKLSGKKENVGAVYV